MEGITYIKNFIENPSELFKIIVKNVVWDERMTSRKTASFGLAYNYSQISYPHQKFLPELETIIDLLKPVVGFEPNNCLINFYMDGKSKMGYHSDQTDILATNTGIAIVSIGTCRQIKFRNIADPEKFQNYELNSGSLIYMTQEIQKIWQHAIPKSATENRRISLTFRQII